MIHSRSRSIQHPLRINRDTTKVKESKASLVTIPLNLLSMLESVKEENLDSKIEDENDNYGYIGDPVYNLEMEIKYEPLFSNESLSDSVAGEQTPELDPPAQADPVPVKSTTDGSDTG